MTVIELPDDQAAALAAKAASQGLTLAAWLQRLAETDLPKPREHSVKQAVARILELQAQVKPDPEGWSVKDYINEGRP